MAGVNYNSTFYSCLVTRSVQYGHILVVYDQYLSQVTHILQCSRSNVALGLDPWAIQVVLLKISSPHELKTVTVGYINVTWTLVFFILSHYGLCKCPRAQILFSQARYMATATPRYSHQHLALIYENSRRS